MNLRLWLAVMPSCAKVSEAASSTSVGAAEAAVLSKNTLYWAVSGLQTLPTCWRTVNTVSALSTLPPVRVIDHMPSAPAVTVGNTVAVPFTVAVTSMVAAFSAPVPRRVTPLTLVMASLLLSPLSDAPSNAKDLSMEGAGALTVELQVTEVAACKLLVLPARSVYFKPRSAVEAWALNGKVKLKEPSLPAVVSAKTVVRPSSKITLAPASAPLPLTS